MRTSNLIRQSMFVIRSKKMQKAQCLRSSFFLTLVVLLGNWLVTDVDAQFRSSWRRSLLPSKLMQTRRTASGNVISYRLDTWSQYDNPEEGAQREGDIHDLQSRKAVTTDRTLLWPNGVINYYVHSSIVNEPMKLTILEDALETIRSKTCIEFVRIQDYKKVPANNWVNITGDRKGCFSNLGRRSHGPTTLNLDVNSCFRTIGHAIHEMLHTLGVYHEHMRPDRDKYITIMWENIKREYVYNFDILSKKVVTDYGLPYDYDSIMHYSMTAFSINRTLPTIIPTSSPVEIGQRSHLSYYDIQKLLITYNCSSTKSKNLITRKSNINKKFFDPPKLRRQSKPMFETEAKPQTRVFSEHNLKNLEKLEENTYAKSERSVDKLHQRIFSRPVSFSQSNDYPVPLNPLYLYIDFHFSIHKK